MNIQPSKKFVLAIGAGLTLTLLIMKYLPAPYVWVGGLWSSIFFILVCKESRSIHKAIYIEFCVLALVLGAIEFYLWDPFAVKISASGNMWQPENYIRDEVVGYRPPKNANQIIGKKFYGEQLIYDMSFSTDLNAQRVTLKNPNSNKAVAFFGCSLTFGDGVNDQDTLPYQVGIKTQGQYNPYNFGYSGYGAHQMLSALEHDWVQQKVKGKLTHAFYTAIPGHATRSAGLQSWAVTDHDPRFEVNDKGELYFAGHFDDVQEKHNSLKRRIHAHLSNSYILKKLYLPYGFNQKRIQNQNDLERYIKIVAKSRDLFESQNEGAEFHVILWHLTDYVCTEKVFQQILTSFKQEKIRVHLITDILPDFSQDNPQYRILHDGHPTPYANQLIADYIVNHIIAPNRAEVGKV